VDGVPYEFHTIPGGKNSPPRLVVSIPCTTLRPFRLTRENKVDRFFRRLGVNVEMRTFDAAFDDRFYIHTNFTGFARELFRNREARTAATEIHERGFRTIAADGRRIAATLSPYRRSKDASDERFAEIASLLAAIARVDVRGGFREEDGPPNWRTKRVIAFASVGAIDLLGVASLAAGLSFYRPLDAGPLVLTSLAFSIPALAVFLWIVTGLLRGRSGSHHEWIIAAAIGIGAFPLAGAGLSLVLNGWLDHGAPTPHIARVIDKYETRTKNGSSYHVLLESWRRNDPEKISVSHATYERIEPIQTTFTVTTKPGALGREWIVDRRTSD
jgi:hypothetical protein